MDKNRIISRMMDFINAGSKEVEISFVNKTRRRDNRYFFFKAPIANDIKDEISNILINGFIDQLDNCELREFDALYTHENTIEYMGLSEIGNYNDFIAALSTNYSENINEVEISKINFYHCCITDTENDEKIHFFKNYRNPKILRNFFPLSFIDQTLRKIDNKTFYIDQLSDLIIFNNVIYICNRNTLNTVFDYKDEFLRNLSIAIEKIRVQNIIENFDQFEEDCMQSMLMARKFTRILRNRSTNFDIVLENFDQVPSKLEELNLDIEFDNQGRIIYSNKEELNDIATIFSDGFARTLIIERNIRAGDDEEVS